MEVINIKELTIGKYIGRGNWNIVNKCTFDNQEFCIKFLNTSYPKEIINNIASLTDIDFEKEYFTPLYVIENNSGHIIGYLMDYNKNLEKLKFESRENAIVMLKNARSIIDKLHNKYKRFHGDVVVGNMLFDKKNKNAFLIDFDVSFKFGEELNDTKYYRLFINDYLQYYKQDKNLDIYAFNITTLMYLFNYDRSYSLLNDISDNKISSLESNKDVKKLSKELLLNDTKKNYSGEYIIDYI